MSTTSKIADSVAARGYSLRNDIATHELARHEDDIARSLRKIMSDAARLLDALTTAEPIDVVREIMNGSGSSGTIGSEWEHALRHATSIDGILRYATQRIAD